MRSIPIVLFFASGALLAGGIVAVAVDPGRPWVFLPILGILAFGFGVLAELAGHD